MFSHSSEPVKISQNNLFYELFKKNLITNINMWFTYHPPYIHIMLLKDLSTRPEIIKNLKCYIK